VKPLSFGFGQVNAKTAGPILPGDPIAFQLLALDFFRALQMG
jgi:hypothetical protein